MTNNITLVSHLCAVLINILQNIHCFTIFVNYFWNFPRNNIFYVILKCLHWLLQSALRFWFKTTLYDNDRLILSHYLTSLGSCRVLVYEGVVVVVTTPFLHNATPEMFFVSMVKISFSCTHTLLIVITRWATLLVSTF